MVEIDYIYGENIIYVCNGGCDLKDFVCAKTKLIIILHG